MAWPLSQDYNEAIQDCAANFSDPELKQGEAVCNALGLPTPCSGNFADVYAVTSGNKKWAVKCFTREIPGLQERYVQISQYLKQVQLPFMVEFAFLQQGIRVRGQWYPVLKMQWVEGFQLNTFVKDNLDKPQVLQTLCQIWLRLAAKLRESNLAHGDLQHGNVLLVPGNKAGMLGVRLVDYDGMCVPALEQLKSIEVGHPAYQHPVRLKDGGYGLEIDRFANLVIYTALRALCVGGKALWGKFDNGDNLLFKQQEFEAPATSPVFQELLTINDPEVRRLVQVLGEAAQKPLDKVPPLDALVALPKPTTKVTAAAPPPPPAPAPAKPENVFAGVTDEADDRPKRRPPPGKSKMEQKPLLFAAIAGGVGVGLLVLVGGALLVARSFRQPAEATPVAQAPPETHAARPTSAIPPTRPTLPETRPTAPEPRADPPKVDPKVDVTPTGFRFVTLPEEFIIAPGGEGTFEFTYDRGGLQGRLGVNLKGLPIGVRFKSGRGFDALNKVAITLAANADVQELSQMMRVQLLLGQPVQTVEKEMRITIKKAAVPDPATKPPVPVVRLPVPDEAKQAEALKTIKDLFKKEYARTKPAEKLELANKLVETAGESKTDPVSRYVLLNEARELAAAAGDVELMMSCLEQMDAEFAIDGLTLKVAALTKAGSALSSAAPSRKVAEASLRVIDDLVAQDKFDAAAKLVDVAEAAARRSQQPTLLKTVQARAKDIAETQKEAGAAKAAAAKLEETPDDPAAALVLGQFLCFRKGDWDKGLPLLAFAGDTGLQAVAKKDLTRPVEAAAQIEVGDAWWDLGEARGGALKPLLQARAAHWYELARPSQAGLTAEKLDKRIAAIEQKPVSTYRELRRFNSRAKVFSVAWSPDGARAISGGADGVMHVWDMKAGKETSSTKTSTAEIRAVAWSPDGRYTIAASSEGQYKQFDTDGANRNGVTHLGTGEISTVAFAPDNRILIIRKFAREASLTPAVSGIGLRIAPGKADCRLLCGVPSADGSAVVLAGADGLVEVYAIPKALDFAPPRLQKSLEGHTKDVLSVAVSRDAGLVLAGSTDRTARLWDVASGKSVLLRGHQDSVTGVALSADGRLVVTASDDKTIRVWDPKTGRELRRYLGHTGAVNGICLSRDGRYLLSAGSDMTVRLWDLGR